MKACIFLDTSNLSTFYIYPLIKEDLKKKGISLDIYVNPFETTMGFNEKQLRNSGYDNFVYKDVVFGFPSEKEYSALFLSNALNKDAPYSCGERLAFQFSSAGKKVISLKSSTCLTNHNWNRDGNKNLNITYALPQKRIGLVKGIDHLKNMKRFEMSPLDLYKHQKPFHLSRQNFYSKYNVSDDYKIISFFPSGMHGHKSCPTSHRLHKDLESLNKLLNKKGYQIVCKLHPHEYFGRKAHFYDNKLSSDFYFKNLPTIMESDAYELIKYSSFSLTSLTTMVWEHYVYDLPTINVGFGDDFSAENVEVQSYFYPDFDFRGLIFGDIYSGEEFFNNPGECFDLSFSRNHDVGSFEFKGDNPIMGKAHSETMENISSQFNELLSHI